MNYPELTLRLKDRPGFYTQLPSSYKDYVVQKFEAQYLEPFYDQWNDYWDFGTFIQELDTRLGSGWVAKEFKPYRHFVTMPFGGCEVKLLLVIMEY